MDCSFSSIEASDDATQWDDVGAAAAAAAAGIDMLPIVGRTARNSRNTERGVGEE